MNPNDLSSNGGSAMTHISLLFYTNCLLDLSLHSSYTTNSYNIYSLMDDLMVKPKMYAKFMHLSTANGYMNETDSHQITTINTLQYK